MTLSYRVDLKPTLEKFVLQQGEGGQQGDVIDLEWRSIVVKDSVIVNAPEYGNIDTNPFICYADRLRISKEPSTNRQAQHADGKHFHFVWGRAATSRALGEMRPLHAV